MPLADPELESFTALGLRGLDPDRKKRLFGLVPPEVGDGFSNFICRERRKVAGLQVVTLEISVIYGTLRKRQTGVLLTIFTKHLGTGHRKEGLMSPNRWAEPLTCLR